MLRTINYKKAGDMMVMSNNVDFSGYFVGEVLDINISNRRVAVHIPKLMQGIASDLKIESVSPTMDKHVTNIEGPTPSNTVNIRNSIWVDSLNYDEPLPTVGSKVLIFYLDNNPHNAFWEKFNPNNDYEVIEEERYPKYFTFKINGNIVDVHKDDTIELNFPENMDVLIRQNNKVKTIDINSGIDYVISPTAPERPKQGLMWYNSILGSINVFKDNSFKRLLTDDDMGDVYNVVGEIEDINRIYFAKRLEDITYPELNMVVAIDNIRGGQGFYTYKSVNSLSSWNLINVDGIYHLSWTGVDAIYEIKNGQRYMLQSYKYDDGWEILDKGLGG